MVVPTLTVPVGFEPYRAELPLLASAQPPRPPLLKSRVAPVFMPACHRLLRPATSASNIVLLVPSVMARILVLEPIFKAEDLSGMVMPRSVTSDALTPESGV